MNNVLTKGKEKALIILLNSYIWATRGSYLDDEYQLSDEDDFEEFLKEFREIFSNDTL